MEETISFPPSHWPNCCFSTSFNYKCMVLFLFVFLISLDNYSFNVFEIYCWNDHKEPLLIMASASFHHNTRTTCTIYNWFGELLSHANSLTLAEHGHAGRWFGPNGISKTMIHANNVCWICHRLTMWTLSTVSEYLFCITSCLHV